MTIRRTRAVAAAGFLAVLCAGELRADTPPLRDPFQEAADRTKEGVRHADRQEFEAALADFQRAFELTQNPVLLLNIASMYEALDRPAEATDAFDRALANKGALPPDNAARAVVERDAQAARTGQLDVVTNVPAQIEIDNVVRERTPLATPLRVSAGTHVVGGLARGYAPLRVEVSVAPKAVADVSLELVPMAGTAAQLWVKTHLPDADVFIDGKLAGQTPLPKSLAVLPGKRVVELKRPGYTLEQASIQLDEGSTGEVVVEPKLDRATASDWGRLELSFSEPLATVAVDGGPPRAGDSFDLPRGKHHLLLERAGFLPIERTAVIEPKQTTRILVTFDPDAQTRADYTSRVSGQKTWGTALTIGGAVVAGLGAAYLIYNQGQKNDAESAYNQQVALTQPGAPCNPITTSMASACQAALDSAHSSLDDARGRDLYGYLALGAGAVSLGVGVYLLLTAGDAHRYDVSRSWQLRPQPGGALWSTRF